VKSKSKDISGELVYRNCLNIGNKKNQLLREPLPKRKEIVIPTHATQYIKFSQLLHL
jgi:hypothetical protein